MKCTEYEGHVNQFIDGETSLAEQARLLQHLAICDQCQIMLHSVMHMREAVRKEVITYPSELDRSVLGQNLPRSFTTHVAASQANRGQSFWDRHIVLPTHLAVSAAILITAIGLLVGRFLVSPTEPSYYSTARGPGIMQPQTVILVYGMPPVEVLGSPTARTLDGHR